MRKVTLNKSGKLLAVNISVDDTAYKFPADHKTIFNGKGEEMYTIPIVYWDLDSTDDAKPLSEIIAAYVALGMKNPRKAMTSGLRLAFGNMAKAKYKAKKATLSALELVTWLTKTATAEQREAYEAISDPIAALKYVCDRINGVEEGDDAEVTE
jgi:hypothetical protein